MRARLAAWVLLAGSLATASFAGESAPFETCDRGVDAAPESLEAWRCYWKLSRRMGRPEEALAAVGVQIDARGGDPRGELYRACILRDLRDPRAESGFARASAGCAGLEDWTCVVYSRLSLADLHRYEPERAWPELERAEVAARSSGDRVLLARIEIGRGFRALFEEEYGSARAAFLAAGEALGELGPYDARDGVLSGLGYAAWATGRLEEAKRLYGEEVELARAAPDPYVEASAAFNVLLIETLLLREQDPGASPSLAEFDDALAAALRARDPSTGARVRLLLAQSGLVPERVREELAAARQAAAKAGDLGTLAEGYRSEAVELAAAGRPEEAMAWLEQGIQIARDGRVSEEILRGELAAPLLLWSTGDRPAAIGRARRAVADLERLLSRQPLARDRVGLERRWTDAAYAVARMLAENGEPDRAIEILERLRSRSVLDGLAGAAEGVTGGELAAVRAEIAALQGRLLESDEEGGEHARILRQLARAEEREEALLVELGAVRLDSASPPTLARLQSALPAEEVLLCFQVPVWSEPGNPFGGAWLLAIDRQGTRVFALPEPADLRRAVDAFDGLVGRSDPPARRAATRLHSQLLAPALAGLAPTVRRLVLLPDGPLHRLAFEALAAGEREPLLGETFELERAGSLAAWLAAADAGQSPRPAETLVLADPDLAAREAELAPWRRSTTLRSQRLGRLAGARREADELARLFGEHAQVLLGAGASEHALKRADLSHVGLLHLAAHAVVDDRRPYRSAILLAPGDGEDGLLQMRDIVALRLDGAIVVLASCRSAQGARLAGEGVFSLARAFLDAGASAVIANLRALDDRESNALFSPFFRALRNGQPVRTALAQARRSSASGGSTVWATTILLGDGDARLEQPKGGRVPALFWAALLGALALGGALWAGRAAKRRGAA